MKSRWAYLGIVLAGFVAVVAIVVAIALLMWPQVWLSQPSEGPAPAMRECMGTCTTWHLVGSLYHRGFCRSCETLPVCAGQREQPAAKCMAELRACYQRNACMSAVRLACDKRCTVFLEGLQRAAPGQRW